RGSGIAQGFHQRGVLFAQDGVPFADADGFSDFQSVDALSARYVEVWKGANTLRFGGAQLGGAINLVTPTGRTARQRALMQVDGGRDHSEQSQGRLTVNAGRSFGDDRELRLIAQAADIKQDMPGALTLKQALETPRMASAGALSGDQARDLTVRRLTLQTRWRFDEATLFEGAVWGWE